jgi:outer membrane protein W
MHRLHRQIRLEAGFEADLPMEPDERAVNRQVRAAASSCHSHTVSGSGSFSVAVRWVPVSAPNSGTVVDAAQSRAGSIDTKCTATVSPGSAPSM